MLSLDRCTILNYYFQIVWNTGKEVLILILNPSLISIPGSPSVPERWEPRQASNISFTVFHTLSLLFLSSQAFSLKYHGSKLICYWFTYLSLSFSNFSLFIHNLPVFFFIFSMLFNFLWSRYVWNLVQWFFPIKNPGIGSNFVWFYCKEIRISWRRVYVYGFLMFTKHRNWLAINNF